MLGIHFFSSSFHSEEEYEEDKNRSEISLKVQKEKNLSN